ncbi:MAG TPA: N-acetyltransferase [Kiloniellales bacterium]|jgi:putative acetyltransferase
MIEEIEIRESRLSDVSSIETLYSDAFPDEDLLPLVRELLSEEHVGLSLAGIVDRALVGHVIFTACGIAGRTDKVSLLGPLAVAPVWQRRGIGSTLVCAGLQRLENAGAIQVYVLGDPAYYERVGFRPESGVSPPYPLPEEWHCAWQSVSLDKAVQAPQGKLSVPQPWRRPALWAP